MRLLGLRIVGVTVGVGALVWLLSNRPDAPELPGSFDSPLTVTAVEETAMLLLWVTACLVALGLLVRVASQATVVRRSIRDDALLDMRRPFGAQPSRSRPAVAGSAPVYAVRAAGTPTTSTSPGPDDAMHRERAPAQEAPRPERVSPTVSVSLLGTLVVEGAEKPRRAATRELVAYLALRHEATRDELLEALWPGEDPRRTRPRLWQSVSEAGRVLGDGFVRETDHYRLDREKVRVDLDEFERQLEVADSAADPTAEYRALEAAHKLWRGAALSGTDYAWTEPDLRQLGATKISLLERIARARLDRHDAAGALAVAEEGLASEELHEGLWRLALQAESDLGRRDAVEERYTTLQRVLDDRLGVQPERDTVALYRRLLGQN